MKKEQKEPVGIRAAKINGKYAIIAAVVVTLPTLIGIAKGIILPKIGQTNSAIEKQEIEDMHVDQSEKSDQNTDNLVIPSILPENEKNHPQSAYDHNAKAKKILDKIISMRDKDIEDLLDKVFEELDKSYAIDKEFGETQYFYGVAFFKKGDFYVVKNNINDAITAYNDSLHYFGKAKTSYSHISNTYYDEGKTYKSLGDIYQNRDAEESKNYYQKAIDSFSYSLVVNYIYPENVYFAMGIIYDKIEDYQKSKECYTNALKTANDQDIPKRKDIFFGRSNASFQLGMISFQKKDYEMAVQHYKNSIDDNPENYGAHSELGRIYCDLNLWQEAVSKFDFILERNPKNFDLKTVQTNRGFAYRMLVSSQR